MSIGRSVLVLRARRAPYLSLRLQSSGDIAKRVHDLLLVMPKEETHLPVSIFSRVVNPH
jgi:hypothetical protein